MQVLCWSGVTTPRLAHASQAGQVRRGEGRKGQSFRVEGKEGTGVLLPLPQLLVYVVQEGPEDSSGVEERQDRGTLAQG